VIHQFVAQEPCDLGASVAPEKVRVQRIADAVVLIYRTRAVLIVGVERTDRVPLVQQVTQFSLRLPSPDRVMLHAVWLQSETHSRAAMSAICAASSAAS
jgi:hypothetical protein